MGELIEDRLKELLTKQYELKREIADCRKVIRKARDEEERDRQVQTLGRTIYGMKQLGFSSHRVGWILWQIDRCYGRLPSSKVRALAAEYFRRTVASDVLEGESWVATPCKPTPWRIGSLRSFTPWMEYDHFNFAINQVKVYQ